MTRKLILSLLVCGLFANGGCVSAQSNSSNASKAVEPQRTGTQTAQSVSNTQADAELFKAVLKNGGKGDLDAVKKALESGANPNAVTNLDELGTGLTPLILSVGNEEIIGVLLEKGANPNVESKIYIGGLRDLRSSTPLIEAASRGKIETVRLLFDANADVNAKTDEGFPTLFSAIKHAEILRLMLEKGADPNVKDKDGTTPLMAVVSGAAYDQTKIEKVKILMEKGADPGIKDKSGRSPLDIARSYNDQAIVNFFQNAGNTNSQSGIIGLIKNKPDRTSGCYLAPLSEVNKMASERRYYFVDDELGGLMNIDGKDIFLEQTGDSATKLSNGKKKLVWTFKDQQTTVRFEMIVKKTANEGASVSYDATITVTKGERKQTVKAEGFCGE